MSEASVERDSDRRRRWNTDVNPAVEGDEYVVVAAINHGVRTFRKLRARFRRATESRF